MKSQTTRPLNRYTRSPPARGAWIEIFPLLSLHLPMSSPPARGAWIEIPAYMVTSPFFQSPPARGAWIEIQHPYHALTTSCTSPPARGAWIEILKQRRHLIIWNLRRPPHGGRGLKSSLYSSDCAWYVGSPPARGAWIEISRRGRRRLCPGASPPARGAWIEIAVEKSLGLGNGSRPPHGGRGLKCPVCPVRPAGLLSPPARGAWIEILQHLPLCVQRQAVAPRTGGVD